MVINKEVILIATSVSLCSFFITSNVCFAQQPAPTIINYTYDPSGQRITVSNGITTTVYPTKNYNTDGTTTTKHVFANGADTATIQGTGVTAKVYYNSADQLNSSTIMTDSTGAIAQTLDYFPFGSIRIDQKATSSTFNEQRKYIGQEYDQDTKLNYLNARYYNATLARFTSQDPVSLAIGDQNQVKQTTGKSQQEILSDPQQLNSYSYASNNPIVNSDPEGKYLETAFDVVMFSWSLHDFKQKQSFWNGFSVVADGLSLALPIPAIVGGLKHGDDAIKFLKGVNKADSIQKTTGNLIDYTSKFSKSFGIKLNNANQTLAGEGISATEHALKQIVGRESRGVTTQSVINAYKSGERYYDKTYNNLNYFKDGVRLSVDNKTGQIITVVTQKTMDSNRFIKLK